MSARDFLFELRTEELPPRALPALSNALTDGVLKGIDAAGIPHGRVHGFATPRRLAVRIQKLAEHQPDRQVERRGPPLKAAFDAQGAPTQAATAFATNCGVTAGRTVAARDREGRLAGIPRHRTRRGNHEPARRYRQSGGRRIAHSPSACAGAPTPRSSCRPVHGVVLLYRRDGGARAGPGSRIRTVRPRATAFTHPSPLILKSAANYAGRLRRAKVVADFAERRELIRAGVNRGGARRAAAPRLIDEALLDEVTALVEWPVPHRRPVRAALLEPAARGRDRHRAGSSALFRGAGRRRHAYPAAFITVSNIESRDPAKVREGNERVVRPRLSDAAFFWEQDRKIPLDAHARAPERRDFSGQVGQYADKTLRVKALARADRRPHRRAAERGARRAARQGRLDDRHGGRVSGTAGHHGPLLRRGAGRACRRWRWAIEEHYRPRFAGDALPASRTGQALALADKIDTLVGIFAIEQRPTGAKDPFGLRRAALGLLRILLEGGLELDLFELSRRPPPRNRCRATGVVDEVYDFIAERLRGMLLDEARHHGGNARRGVRATARARRSMRCTRLQALKEFLLLPEAGILAAINKRIANILKKTPLHGERAVNAGRADRGRRARNCIACSAICAHRCKTQPRSAAMPTEPSSIGRLCGRRWMNSSIASW